MNCFILQSFCCFDAISYLFSVDKKYEHIKETSFDALHLYFVFVLIKYTIIILNII